MKKQLWYLSFADRSPDRFLGACVVYGDDLIDAIKTAWRLKINPGGQVLGVPIENSIFPINRLMNRAELASFGQVQRLGDLKDQPQQIGNN
jgi:hypothetical protein